ncbi:FtsX-like permease family protein [Niameybacter massiliensis]|uniref:FtsX-like permease family protein n=1 Tax=Niameybacter massiliensis TaxID=1658108 RepID=UPI0006B4461B|nr:FtsX-like permease family protein [Niameybacter massiliensis]
MHIMSRFTLTHLKRNKRHAFFSCFAILIATVFISALIFCAHSYKESSIALWIESAGEWHGAFAVDISAKQVAYVKENPEVEKTFIKTNFYALRPNETEGRPYFAHIDLDKNYRNDMGWEDMAILGRLPEKEGEIAISEDFFKDNPQYKIGSEMTVDEGQRVAQGESIDVRDGLIDDELFEVVEAGKTYTIVGILDAYYEYSEIPSYISIGYSDEIREDRTYIVNMQFKNVKDTYKLTPQIAQNIGLTADVEGRYPVRYYYDLLESYGVFEEGVTDQFRSMMMVYGVAILFIMSFFVTIIYHTFAVSANARVKYLGLLKSIGATPKQIRHSVLFEGILLGSISIPIGLLGGYGIASLVFNYLNATYKTLEMNAHVDVYISIGTVVMIVVMTLAIILISAYFPARKVAKLSPIVAIKQGDYKVEKLKDTVFSKWIGKVLGYEGTLALKSNRAHRKGFRTAYIFLTISFVILMGGIIYLNVWNLSVSYEPRPINYEMKLYLSDVGQDEFERLDREVRAINEVEKVQRNKGTLYGQTQVSLEDLSPELQAREKTYLEQEAEWVDGKYDFTTEFLAIDDASFNEYCERIGADAAEFYEGEEVKAILYNLATYNNRAIREEQETIPLFDWEKGKVLTVTEDLDSIDKATVPYTFDVEVGYVTDQIIDHGRYYDYYRVILIIPESMSQRLVTNFTKRNQERYNRDISYLEVAEEDIPVVKAQIEEIYDRHKDKANFRMWDIITSREGQQKSTQLIMMIAGIGVGFITLIGIVNIYSTLSNQMNIRRKEFAMLKSVGISPAGIKKILLLESAFYSIKPIIYSIPILIGVGILMLTTARFSWMNIWSILPYGFFIIGSIILSSIIFSLSYFLSRKVIKETIIDVIKDEMQ